MNTQAPRLAFSLIVSALALISCAAPPIAASQPLRAQVAAYELEVLIEGAPARTFAHAGESYLLGALGERYVLRVHNRSGRRIEAVAAVDGLDVIDGKSADFVHKRGYLVPAYGYVDIEGWRLSEREAAAFRFASVDASYAGKTGRARHVGVIGVAVFPERSPRPAPRAYVVPESSYSEPAHSEREQRSLGGAGAEAKGRASPPSSGAAPAPPAPRASAEAADSARAEAPAAESARRSRSGLGTEFGEALSSEIRQVAFVRAQSARPSALLGVRYNDRAGLYALGIDVDAEPSDLALRQTAEPFPVSRRSFARPPADWARD